MRARIAPGVLITVAALGSAVACSSSAQDPSSGALSGWQGTITTEGDVTTVVNESGSVWAGEPVLVEEASIGVQAGADEYMLGGVSAVWAAHERIFVLDWQVPAVRVYNLAGEHLLDVGREGEGPGEFLYPADLAVTGEGDVLVVDRYLEVDVFGLDGTPEETWATTAPVEVGFGGVLVLGPDDVPWVPYADRQGERFGRIRYGPDGFSGEPRFRPEPGGDAAQGAGRECLTYRREGSERRYCDIPFAPAAKHAFTPAGEWVVGSGDEYRFEVHGPEGPVRVVERHWDPVPVGPEEIEYHERRIVETIRERGDPDWTWTGPAIPDHKPAFVRLLADRDGRVWVLREQASRRSSDCADGEPTCWEPEGYWLDAFDLEGRFLGSVPFERLPVAPLFIDGDTIVAVLADEAGTTMVKRFRLQLPGEDGP